MAVITDILQGLGLLPATTVGPAAASAQLALQWPPAPTTMAEGTVSTTSGDLDRAGSPQPRVVTFLAAETTPRGLGELVHGWLRTIQAPSQPLPDPVAVARAVLAYHATDLALPDLVAVGSTGPARRFPAWTVGRGIRLPIELDAHGGWVTDLGRWTALGRTADAGWDIVLDWTPAPLPLPDPLGDQQSAADLIGANPSLETAAPGLRESLLVNPSAAVYEFLAVARAVDGVAEAQADALWTTLALSTLSTDETALLATTLPGAVALRCLYRRLSGRAAQPGHPVSVDEAVAALNTALGISGGTPVDLTVTTPSVVPRELPVSRAWSVRPEATRPPWRDLNGERDDGRHDLVLGRDLHAGTWDDDGRYHGPAYAGNNAYSVSAYVAAHHDEVFDGADTTTQARLSVVSAIAAIEGFLDAVRQRDRGILSLGVHQWAVHVDDELNVLLWNLAQTRPDDYDAHLGVHGLQLTRTDTWSGQPTGMPAGSTRAATLVKTGAGTTPSTAMPAPDPAPDHPPDRLSFFGGTVDPAHPDRFRFDETPWAGRLRSAARCSQALRLLQLRTATDRFGRIRSENRTWPVGPATCSIDQLATSVQGAAQVLDQHVNAPGHLAADVATAISRVTVTPTSDASGLTAAWLAAFEAEYLTAVRYGPGATKTDTTLPSGTVVRGRQSYLLSQHLSSAPHSFQGW